MGLRKVAALCCHGRSSWGGVMGSRGASFASPHFASHRAVHERPFYELPRDPARGEAYEVARDALLQLNIMTRRGIEPDALMYTSLINIMGRAGLEWQAYKLFSRMVEANVRPLPETYVALRDATAKHRAKLRDDIQTKIEEAISTFPEELAAEETARQRDEDRQCVAKFEDYMRGELPPPLPAPSFPVATAKGTEPASSSPSTSASAAAPPEPVVTMSIRNPTDVWSTAQRAGEIRGRPETLAKGDAALDLRVGLSRLHEEELRIYLSTNRQLRHGSKIQLIDRVLENVGEHAIRAMLNRRAHYFRSVEQILAADLEVVKNATPPSSLGSNERADRHAGEADRTMAKAEKESVSPEVLLTPWGLVRKPLRYREDRTMGAHHGHRTGEDNEADTTAATTIERVEKVRLTAPELLLIRHKAETDDLDELPESVLRRYAHQFRLRWRRRQPTSLLDAVSWHATTFLIPGAKDTATGDDGAALVATPPPTPPIRLQKEQEGMQETLENFEAFRIIAQRTNNLQVVDDREINLHLKRIRRDALKQERKTEEGLRREHNILAAAGLAASARSYTASPSDELLDGAAGSHVLGWGTGGDAKADVVRVGAGGEGAGGGAREQSATAPDELPPWEIAAGEEEFNLSTGRFGDPDAGRFQELSDSSIRVLPSREAQKQWTVDRHLLPGGLKDRVEKAELAQLRYHETVESEYSRRRQYAKYRKWDNMIQKAAKKKKAAETGSLLGDGDGGVGGSEGGEARRMQPLPAKRRLAQLLRRGVEKQKVSEAMKHKFNKEL